MRSLLRAADLHILMAAVLAAICLYRTTEAPAEPQRDNTSWTQAASPLSERGCGCFMCVPRVQ